MKAINRRKFIKRCAVCACGVGAWGALPGFSIGKAQALTGNGTKVLFINMNGGWDGLYVLQPTAGSTFNTLTTMRSSLLIDPSTLLPVSGNFGFHPHLTTMKALYDEGRLLSVLNVGYSNMSRSHADAEVAYARGVADRLSPASSGFISRIGSEFNWNNLQAVSVSGTDRSFEGMRYRGTQVYGLSDYRFVGDHTQSWTEGLHRRDMLYSLAHGWVVDESKPKQSEQTVGMDVLINTSDAVREAISQATFTQNYPNTNFGQQLRDIDVLFSTPSLGTEVGYMRRGGFDTHSDQLETMDRMLPEFNTALSCFINNMKAKGLWNNLIVVVFSEFGRTNRENGSLGTDHGGALPVFLLGGAVAGGLIGDIVSADLTDHGWLPMKVNIIEIYRQILARMNYDPDRVFERPAGTSLPGIFV